jgi:hypothetical protein
MNIDFSTVPTSLDAVHLGLSVAALIFLLLFMLLLIQKKSSQPGGTTKPQQQDQSPAKPDAPVVKLKVASPDAALQLLALLQQEARLIDFLKEDLGSFSDADIGAAARVVHEGGQKALNDYFSLAPIRNEDEESRITLKEGFNATEVRLTGNVVGAAPFTGTLVHRGWRVTEVKLPKLASGHDVSIIAPAEVEL